MDKKNKQILTDIEKKQKRREYMRNYYIKNKKKIYKIYIDVLWVVRSVVSFRLNAWLSHLSDWINRFLTWLLITGAFISGIYKSC